MQGGGLYVEGQATLNSCQIYSNTAYGVRIRPHTHLISIALLKC